MRNTLVVLTLSLITLLACGGSANGGISAAPQLPRFLWGAWVGDQFTGAQPPWDWNAATAFEARNAGRRHMSALHWSVGSPWDHEFNYWVGAFNLAQNAGVVSVVDMGTSSHPLRSIANGADDEVLTEWATQAAAWGQPFLLRFDFEMNGSWYPWGSDPAGQTEPADYVAAWRHVHQLFTNAGATNVLWVWCPNIDPYSVHVKLDRVYPGNGYVDWTCIDGYNFGNPWMSFRKLYALTYDRITRLAPDKPMIIGEVGSTERGGHKERWIRNMFRALDTRFPRIHGLLWYDVYAPNHLHPGKKRDWPIETSKASSAAFNKGLARTLGRVCRGLSGGARRHCLGR